MRNARALAQVTHTSTPAIFRAVTIALVLLISTLPAHFASQGRSSALRSGWLIVSNAAVLHLCVPPHRTGLIGMQTSHRSSLLFLPHGLPNYHHLRTLFSFLCKYDHSSTFRPFPIPSMIVAPYVSFLHISWLSSFPCSYHHSLVFLILSTSHAYYFFSVALIIHSPFVCHSPLI